MVYKKRADIHKAFELLQNAIEAKEAELKQKLESPKYPAAVNHLVANSFEAVNASVGKLEQTAVLGQEYAQIVTYRLRQSFERDRWGFLGKVAVCSFGLGLILGSRWRNSRSRVKT